MKHKTNYDKVRDFHLAMAMLEGFTQENLHLRKDLVFEEAVEVEDEFCEALSDLREFGFVRDEIKARLTKELCDLLYVVYGTGVSLGIDLDDAFEEVHRSNMSKLGDDGKPIKRDDGKVIKGPNYSPANMERFV